MRNTPKLILYNAGYRSPHRAFARPALVHLGGEGSGHPFSQNVTTLTQAEHIELKCQGRYWKRQHARLKEQLEKLKQELVFVAR